MKEIRAKRNTTRQRNHTECGPTVLPPTTLQHDASPCVSKRDNVIILNSNSNQKGDDVVCLKNNHSTTMVVPPPELILHDDNLSGLFIRPLDNFKSIFRP